MKALRDPERVEFNHLITACHLPGKNILEIGCGKGTLTWQYAGLAWNVVGIDPAAADILQAKTDAPASPSNTSFVRAKGEALPFPPGSFDVVLFASSL
jgi:ubiquinone/menaquinone biosynthesis C-methylase UbiE